MEILSIYLNENVSIQRRHQKVVEEAPSAILTEELRKQMGEAAVKVAKSLSIWRCKVRVNSNGWQ